MARVSTDLKRAFLRELIWKQEELGEPFAETLKTFARSKVAAFGDGSILSGTAGNGHSVTFAVLPGHTPADMLELSEEYFQLLSIARSNVISAGTASPTDAQITTEMMSLLVPVYELTGDYSYLSR